MQRSIIISKQLSVKFSVFTIMLNILLNADIVCIYIRNNLFKTLLFPQRYPYNPYNKPLTSLNSSKYFTILQVLLCGHTSYITT